MTVVLDPEAGSTSGVTLDSIVDRVQQTLNQKENLNILAGSLDESVTEIPLTYSLSGIARGVEVNVGEEALYVWETDAANKSLTVRRGHGGTTPLSHDAGDLVHIGGKSRRQIIDALNDELAVLSSAGLFQMKSAPISDYNYSSYSFEVPALSGITDVYDVQYLAQGETAEWVHVPGWRWSAIDNTITFAHCSPWSTDVRVLYKARFKPFTNGDDDIQATVGLQSEAADILVYGACWRLLAPDEAQRNNIYSQGDTRRPSEIPAGAIRASGLGFKQIRDERIAEEKDRLRRQFPVRKSGF